MSKRTDDDDRTHVPRVPVPGDAASWAYRRQDVKGSAKFTLVTLALFASLDEDNRWTCWPHRATLAAAVSVSVDRVKQILRELESAGLLVREQRRRDDGRHTSSRFVLPVDGGEPATHGPRVVGSPDGGESAPPTVGNRLPPIRNPEGEPNLNPTPSASNAHTGDTRAESLPEHRDDPRIPKAVNRKPVAKGEAWLACRIMNYWTARVQMRPITGTDVGRAIIGRIREDPDMDATEHRRIIDANLARPFWDGKAPPTVLYGNGKAWASAKAKAEGGARGASYRHPDQRGREAMSATEQSRPVVEAAVRELREAEARGEDWFGRKAED